VTRRTTPSDASPVPRRVAAADASQPMDVIYIEGFVGLTVIGIHASELHEAQPIVVDLQAGMPRAKACQSDAIADTIDYGAVHARLRTLYRDHQCTLLESFADAIATVLIVDFGAAWARVKVAKPKKFDDVASVGVVIERSAEAPAAPVGDELSRTAVMLRMIGSGVLPGGR
jgi:7,8-dihydroneopterin aldolase/epimerase/oxygenase